MRPPRLSFASGAVRADAGLTLLEVLVTAALLSLVLALSVNVFTPALTTWTRGQQRSQAQRATLVATRWLRHDVELCASEAVTTGAGSVMLILCSPGGECDATGQTRWTRGVLYWLDGDKALRRQEWALPPDTEPAEVSAPAPDPDARVIARDLVLFDVREEPSGISYRVEAVAGRDACRAVGLARPLLGLALQAPD